MNYKWIPGLLILVVLISGCTSSGPSTETQPVITAPMPAQTTVSLRWGQGVEYTSGLQAEVESTPCTGYRQTKIEIE